MFFQFNIKILGAAAFLSFGAHASSASEVVDWNWVHAATSRGINRLYNLEVDEALASFDSVARLAPNDPRGPFFQSLVHYYLYGLNRDEQNLQKFFDKSEVLIEICEELLEQNKNDARVKFYLGGMYGYRGLAYHTNGSFLKAAHNGRKGYMLLEEAVRSDPTLYDAQMGFGLFQYLVAKVPRSMSWILNILGIDGDLEGGLAMLRRAAEKGLYTRTEAKLYLAQFLFTEGKRDTAVRYLNELRSEFPENTLFTVLYAFWQHRQNNLDEALKAAHEAEALNKRKKIRYGEELAFSTLGSIYFTLNDFNKANAYFKQYMALTTNDERSTNRTIYRAGVAAELTGDRTTALQFYKRVRDIDDRDRAWESFYRRKAQQAQVRPMTEAEAILVRAENFLSRKEYSAAQTLYEQVLSMPQTNADAKLGALYGLIQIKFDLKKYEDVVKHTEEVLALQPETERWLVPHALFKGAQTFAQLGRREEAQRMFERIRGYKNYDFQERLEARVDEELKRLRQS